MDSQMMKGVLEMCVLQLISEEKRYGYEIMRLVGESFCDVSESTVYAVLKRLSNDGRASVSYGTVSGGPTRKYFIITEQGRQSLDASIESWHKLLRGVNALGIK